LTVCFIVDAARKIDENVVHIMHQLEDHLEKISKQLQIETEKNPELASKEVILVLNKVFIAPSRHNIQRAHITLLQMDLVKPKDLVLPLINKLNETNVFSKTFLTAAVDGYKVDELKEFLLSRAKPRPWEFAAEVVSFLHN
jgi:GTPase Era involved in 16S rRNA processing